MADRLRYEFIAAMFWLIERPMVLLLLESGHECRPSLGEHPTDRLPVTLVKTFPVVMCRTCVRERKGAPWVRLDPGRLRET